MRHLLLPVIIGILRSAVPVLSNPRPSETTPGRTMAPVVTIENRPHPRRPAGIRLLFLCDGCSDPARDGGSHIDALIAARGPRDFNVTGAPLVYAVPNHGLKNPTEDEEEEEDGGGAAAGPASALMRVQAKRKKKRRLLNAEEIPGAVALMHRGGGVPVVDKALQAQEGGAVAAVVIDDGRCDEDFTSCGHHAGTAHSGFGMREDWTRWERVGIPCVVVTEKGGKKLREAMAVEEIDFGMGPQYVSALREDGRHRGVNHVEL